MKKLLIAATLSSLSTVALAGNNMDKVTQTFSELDTDNSSMLTAEELSKTPLSGKMSSLDMNSDNMLSESEFDQVIADNPSMFATKVFDKMEADRSMDGLDQPMKTTTFTEDMVKIDDTDATAIEPETMVMEDPGTKSEIMAEAEFKLLDLDKNGTLSKSEAMSGEDSLDFSDIDSDNNQKITQQEFANYMADTADE